MVATSNHLGGLGARRRLRPARFSPERSLSVAAHTVTGMSTSTLGASRGRFRSGCLCGRSGGFPKARTSGLETTVFNVLDFVLGCGTQDVVVPFDGRTNLDMLFSAHTGFRLGVEYDGAYWHRGHEARDYRKSERLVHSRFVHEMLRIREHPLEKLGELDLQVPRGAQGQEVAAHVLLHLSHTVAVEFGHEARERIDFHLSRPARRFDAGRMRCRHCRSDSRRFG